MSEREAMAVSRLGLHAYQVSKELEALDVPFYALIAAAMRRADTENVRLLRGAFPDVWDELVERYNAPGGLLENER